MVAGPTTRDLVLPFATLSGKTTDQNGVAVGEVAVTFTDNNYHFFPGDLGNTYILYPSSTVTSDANGDYEAASPPPCSTASASPARPA
ncbi:MAG: hypothetical protein N838_35980 [Thiohalocapsa sp. PB-PSB1]|nr:MAG: hypothetical protein N838_35980 [Thiohalocapsa sp. PB-PSB1]